MRVAIHVSYDQGEIPSERDLRQTLHDLQRVVDPTGVRPVRLTIYGTLDTLDHNCIFAGAGVEARIRRGARNVEALADGEWVAFVLSSASRVAIDF